MRRPRLRSCSVTWNGSLPASGTRSVTDPGPACRRTDPTAPPGGGVPGASDTTSAAFTQAAAPFDSCSRT